MSAIPNPLLEFAVTVFEAYTAFKIAGFSEQQAFAASMEFMRAGVERENKKDAGA
jgi:hypothetical protein